jgi:hypothetical protein
MGYTAATGRRTSRTDATRARDLAPTAFCRQEFAATEGRRFQLSLNSDGLLVNLVPSVIGKKDIFLPSIIQ